MRRLVERSIALWKAQNGPFRTQVGQHLRVPVPKLAAYDVRPEKRTFIDYTAMQCDWCH